VKRFYGQLVLKILARPVHVAGGMLALLASALILLQFVPQELLAPSQRKQIQMPIELPPAPRPNRPWRWRRRSRPRCTTASCSPR
jgi:multidrug efflux pump subunit AcrB